MAVLRDNSDDKKKKPSWKYLKKQNLSGARQRITFPQTTQLNVLIVVLVFNSGSDSGDGFW